MINVAVLTISDRSFSGERDDLSGPAICQAAITFGWVVVDQGIVPDEIDQISKYLREQVNSGKVNLILTTGGTGFSPRDVTPEATLAVLEKRTPGLVEKIRSVSSEINPHAILSRAEAGICRQCLIVNLPGSPSGAVESLSIISPVLPHAISLLTQKPDSDNHRIIPS